MADERNSGAYAFSHVRPDNLTMIYAVEWRDLTERRS